LGNLRAAICCACSIVRDRDAEDAFQERELPVDRGGCDLSEPARHVSLDVAGHDLPERLRPERIFPVPAVTPLRLGQLRDHPGTRAR
jgi:hypothetical protein